MNALFRNSRRLKVESEDGRNFVLLEAKEIAVLWDSGRSGLLRIPVGAKSDGASTPQIIWSAGLAPFGPYWPDAYAHDAAYRGDLEVWNGSEWDKAMLSKDDSDNLLKALMVSAGVRESIINEIYQGVHLGGWVAFREDRSAL